MKQERIGGRGLWLVIFYQEREHWGDQRLYFIILCKGTIDPTDPVGSFEDLAKIWMFIRGFNVEYFMVMDGGL